MNKLLKISTFFVLLSLHSLFSPQIYAETLANFEKNLIQKYDRQSCASRYECDELNEQVAFEIKQKLNEDPASFNYAFPKLVEVNMLNIKYSPDKRIKFYTMDVSTGGTMREATTQIQFKKGVRKDSQVVTQNNENIGFISQVDQVEIHARPVYFVQSTYIGSSCQRMYGIATFENRNNQFLPIKIFTTKNRRFESIEVESDCKNGDQASQKFIRISKDLKNIDILVVKPSGDFTNQYLRYQKQSNGYRYIGVVR